MPPIASAVNDAWQVRIVGRQENQETNNVLHFTTAAATADVETHLINVMINCFVTTLIPHLTASWKLEQVRWKKVSPALGPEFITNVVADNVGGVAGSALPTFSAALVSIRTLQGGRSKHGRMFLPGIPDSATPGSVLTDTDDFFAALVAFVQCIATNFILGDPPPGADAFQLQVYSRKLGGATFPYGAAGFTPVAQLIVNGLIATLRSRKVGRGS
jgi:hypothetical protein